MVEEIWTLDYQMPTEVAKVEAALQPIVEELHKRGITQIEILFETRSATPVMRVSIVTPPGVDPFLAPDWPDGIFRLLQKGQKPKVFARQPNLSFPQKANQ